MFQFQILALFSLLYVVLSTSTVKTTATTNKPHEICENFTSNEGHLYESQNCSMYCCGTCDDRFCCPDIFIRLDQKTCVVENRKRNGTST